MGRAQEAPPLAGRDLFQGKVLEGVIGLERAKRLLSKNLNALLSLYKAFHLKCFPASKGSNPATPHEVGSHYCALIAGMANAQAPSSSQINPFSSSSLTEPCMSTDFLGICFLFSGI